MAVPIEGLDRLKSQLLITNLQNTNAPLFQVINQLIEFVRQYITLSQGQISALTPSGGGSVVPKNIVQGNLPPYEWNNIEGGEFIPIQGFPGKDGKIGLIGPPGIDGIDGEDSVVPGVPGQQGAQGIPGIAGITSLLGPLFDIPESIDEQIIPIPGFQNSHDVFITGGSLDVQGIFRARGNKVATSGAGLELQYDGTSRGTIITFDRGTTTFKTTRLFGSDLQFSAGTANPAATVDVNGVLTTLFGIALGAELTPASFSTNQNDYNPTGFDTAFFIRLNNTSGGTVNITGLHAYNNKFIILYKVAGSAQIDLIGESASSSAANRITDSIAGFNRVGLYYSPAITRWVPVFSI